MIDYVESPKELTQNPLELINIIIAKFQDKRSIALLYISNEQSEFEIKTQYHLP